MRYENFIYMRELDFIFAYVPKVACTNWKALMRRARGFQDYLDASVSHHKIYSGLTYLHNDFEYHSVINDKNIKKYCCVRDPYTRILSAFLDKIERRIEYIDGDNIEVDYFLQVARKVDSFRRGALDTDNFPELNFEVFLLWLRDSSDLERFDEHWQKQSILLMVDQVEYDIIGRFENLRIDSKIILNAMGLDFEFPSQKDLRFPATAAADKMKNYYSDRAIALVSDIFSEDFNALGYKKYI